MRAAVLNGPGQLDLEERPEPGEPGPGEVLVAVRRVGICGTDLHAYGGRQNFIVYPCILGHELAVEVTATGPGVTRVTAGDVCAVLPYISCGTCAACSRGRGNCCERIQVLGVTRPGGLQEQLLLPERQLFPATGLSLDEVVLVETLGIGWHAVTRAQPSPDDTVLVLGGGPIGLAVAQAVKARAERVIVADISPERVGFAAGTGLETLVVGEGFEAVLREAHGGALPSLVFDATGNRASMEAAFGLTGPAGTLVFVGHTRGELTFANPGFHAREMDVKASRNATPGDWAGVMAALGGGQLDITGWVNHRSSLTSVIDDLPRLAGAAGQVVKAVVDLSEA